MSQTQYFEGRGGSTRDLYRSLGSKGWLSLSWPEALGGGGLPITYDFLLWNELAYWRLARPDFGPGIVAHILIHFGTDTQRDEFLPNIAAGEVCYALGYSEPDAGSDLAGLKTRAVKRGSDYVINGEKCWTSDADNADFLWLLTRTGSIESRSRGLTLFICPTNTPGIAIAPIPTMDGHHINQVLLNDVVLPERLRIGEENQAWELIRGALAVERHLQLLPGRPRRDIEDLVAQCDAHGLLEDPRTLERITTLLSELQLVEASAMTTLRRLIEGDQAAIEAARTRLLGSRLVQDISRTAIELLGGNALTSESVFNLIWRESIMETIAGGSSEMLEGIIGRQSLALGGSQ
jgi:3-oxocholest-4-en-26-oyl-CoA dehydrogenase alpha subunit